MTERAHNADEITERAENATWMCLSRLPRVAGRDAQQRLRGVDGASTTAFRRHWVRQARQVAPRAVVLPVQRGPWAVPLQRPESYRPVLVARVHSRCAATGGQRHQRPGSRSGFGPGVRTRSGHQAQRLVALSSAQLGLGRADAYERLYHWSRRSRVRPLSLTHSISLSRFLDLCFSFCSASIGRSLSWPL